MDKNNKMDKTPYNIFRFWDLFYIHGICKSKIDFFNLLLKKNIVIRFDNKKLDLEKDRNLILQNIECIGEISYFINNECLFE